MGKYFLDQFSLLHYASGVIAYFWGIPFVPFLLLHATFEFVENTAAGIDFINTNLTWWPGGKDKADAFVNIVGDNVSAMAGWYSASIVDKEGEKKGWYK